MTELQNLYHLLAVEEYGTLSAASEALHISQPSLSRSMRKLETEFGTPLFERTKNRIVLNEAGKLAVAEARRVTEAAEELERRMNAYVRSQHTISIGSCAPAPLWEATPLLSARYPDMTLVSEMKGQEELLEGLRSGLYQLIILAGPVDEPGILCRRSLSEQLYLSLPPSHQLARKESVQLSDLDGQTMLLYSELGIWQQLCDERLQNVHFIVQTQREAFADLITASVLPSFTTNLTRRHHLQNEKTDGLDRVNVPIADPEATITFYLCVKERSKRLLDCLERMMR